VAKQNEDAGNQRAAPANLDIVSDVDVSKLSTAEKQMLTDLNTAKEVKEDVFPPSLADVSVPEDETVDTITFSHEPSMPVDDPGPPGEPGPPGKEADVVATGVPVDTPIPDLDVEADSSPSFPPPLQEGPEILPEEDVAEGEALSAGGTSELQNCPHCGWDMGLPTIAEPTYDEKMGFLHSVLGQKTFVHQYELFGGKVIVRFRTLTTKEMDVIYNQVFRERESGAVTTIQDYWEKVNRYRLYLQLTYLSAVDGSFTHTLPDGYSSDANPHADSHYDFKPANPDDSYLPEIEQHVLEEVLRTETIQRSINTMCARFNRLVAKLEAMIDNSDFWEATKEQS
jgi:hypothetical protein